MKTNLFTLSVLSILIAFTACNKKSPAADQPAARSAQDSVDAVAVSAPVAGTPPFQGGRKTSFQEVTAQLDPGGSLFAYLATDQWLAGLATNISAFREVLLALPGNPMQNRAQIDRGFELITRLVRSSGVEDVSGVGVSSAPVAPGLYRNKFILHHPSAAGQGFLWTMFGRAPHDMGGQGMLPTNTVLAGFGDLDVSQFWEVLQRELAQSGIPEAAQAIRAFPEMFEKQTEIPWTPLLESLGGEIGIVLTLDEGQQVSMPMGPGRQLEMGAPALLLAIKVKNNLLYDHISAKLQVNPKTVTSEEDGLKICSMPMPGRMPIPLQPTVASSGDYFYFGTSPEVVRAVQAVRQRKQPGLKSSAEFQDLVKLLPPQGNQFIYVARNFGKTIAELQQQALSGSGLPADQMGMLQRVLGAGPPAYSLAVGLHTATGWQTTSVGNQDSASAVLLVPTVAVTAVSAGMLLPALAKAKGRAQTVNGVNQLKQLSLATRLYANEHKDRFPQAKSWCDDIKEFVGNAKVYKAPNDPSAGECSYAFNEKLSGLDESKINPQTVLFFEATSGWNRSGGSELLLPRPRSASVYLVAFADGSVQQMSAAGIRSLRWEP